MKHTSAHNKASILIVLQSLLVALFMDIKCLTVIITSFGVDENSSAMTILYITTILLIFSLSFIIRKKKPNIGIKCFLVIVYVALSYFFTTFFGGKPFVSLPHLLVFTVCAFLIPSITTINAQLTLKAMMFYPIIGITQLSKIFVFVSEWNEWISMGTSYAFFIPIVATVIYVAVYFKKESKIEKLITIILAITNFVYLQYLFLFGSRGPLVLLFVLLVFLFTIKPNISGVGIHFNKTRLFMLLVVISFILVNFESLMQSLSSVLSEHSISSRAINKFINLSASGDINNGRSVIYDKAFEGFLQDPILGNGLDCFFQNTGEVYPHNFILQILYDGGLLLFVILFIPIIRRMVYYATSMKSSHYSMLSFLLVAGIIGAWFSEDLWRLPLLWISFGVLLTDNNFIYE